MDNFTRPHKSSGSTRTTRLRRSAQACQRCRKRKQKCDLLFPKCSTCEAARAPCLKFDNEKQAEIPRGYVLTLESQVKQLKLEIAELKAEKHNEAGQPGFVCERTDTGYSCSPSSRTTATATTESVTSDPQEMVKSMGLVLLESSNHTQFMGTSSGVSFAKLVLASIKHDIPLAGAESPERQRQHRPTPTEPSTIVTSLPPRHAADHIARAYFSYRTPHLPILEQKSVEIIFNRVYDQPLNCSRRVAEHDMFITYMVLAIGLFSMSTRGGSRPQQSEGCFNAALQRVDTLLSYSSGDLDTLTTLILIAQYLVLNPSRGNLWQLTGVILRLCVDTGLHWETETILAFPEALLNKRRRLYWAAYGLDRFLCINLGRPFGIAEQSMSTRLPDPYISEAADGYESGKLEVLHQRLANHIIKLYRLQSEIKHVLYHQIQGATVAYPRPNYNLWFRDIQSRLRAWHDEIPAAKQCDSECIYAQQAWWEASFSGTVLLLHRPNPLVANPSSESLKTCYDTACRCIRAIKTLQREGHITIVWESVHQLFMAGLTIIYCMWQSPQIRESTSVVDFATVSQDCAVALTALVEYFPEAKGCRDAFELVTSATLRWLGTKAEDNGLDCHGSILNHEIDLVRELMPFSTARWQIHDPGSIFPDEPFELANFLSEAAQYHRPWDLTSDFSLDDLMGDFSSIEGGFS